LTGVKLDLHMLPAGAGVTSRDLLRVQENVSRALRQVSTETVDTSALATVTSVNQRGLNALDLSTIDNTGSRDSTAGLNKLLTEIDPTHGGTIVLPAGYYLVATWLVDSFRNLRIWCDRGAYLLSIGSGSVLEVLDCRNCSFENVTIFGRTNTSSTQDNMPSGITGLVKPTNGIYVHSRNPETVQSEFIYFHNPIVVTATNGLVVGDAGISPSYHQPSDVHIDTLNLVEVDTGLLVQQKNSQAVYADQVSVSSFGAAAVQVVAGDLFIKRLQTASPVYNTAAIVDVAGVVGSSNSVVRVQVEELWDETGGCQILRTTQAQVEDYVDVKVMRCLPKSTASGYAFDIQAKSTDVYLNMDSNYAASGDGLNRLRLHQDCRLAVRGSNLTQAGSPTIIVDVVDDSLTLQTRYGVMGGGASVGLPFVSPRPNLFTGWSQATLGSGDGYTNFAVLPGGELCLDRSTTVGVLPVAQTDYIAVEGGRAYTMTCEVQHATPSGAHPGYRATWYDAGFNYLADDDGFGAGTDSAGPAGGWQQKSATITAPATAAYLVFKVYVQTSHNTVSHLRRFKIEQGRYPTTYLPAAPRSTKANPAASSLPSWGYWPAGSQIDNGAPSSGGFIGWVCVAAGWLVTGAWTTAHAQVYGDLVSNGGRIYRAASSGTTGATAPTHTSGTASDGGVNWTFVATASVATFKTFGVIS
jgi:hypothetical protein